MGVKTAAMKPQINQFFERIINMIIDRERVKTHSQSTRQDTMPQTQRLSSK